MKYTRSITYTAVLAGLMMANGPLIGALAHAAPLAAVNNSVVLSSEAFIERTEIGPDGKERTVTKAPKDVIVVPGDRIIFTLNYVNKGAEPATGFRAVNPMPGPVRFVSVFENWAEVSVDGGTSWGKLEQLQVSKPIADGTGTEMRTASPEDVTHVRWVFADPIAPGGKGSLSFRGVIK